MSMVVEAIEALTGDGLASPSFHSAAHSEGVETDQRWR
jgi:hypothetical protein